MWQAGHQIKYGHAYIILYKSNGYHLKVINEGTMLAIQSVFLCKASRKACYMEVRKSRNLGFSY